MSIQSFRRFRDCLFPEGVDNFNWSAILDGSCLRHHHRFLRPMWSKLAHRLLAAQIININSQLNPIFYYEFDRLVMEDRAYLSHFFFQPGIVYKHFRDNDAMIRILSYIWQERHSRFRLRAIQPSTTAEVEEEFIFPAIVSGPFLDWYNLSAEIIFRILQQEPLFGDRIFEYTVPTDTMDHLASLRVS